MNKERYNQIVDGVYKNYVDKLSYNENDCFADEDINKPNKTFIPYNQQEFINRCKTDKEFSERWLLTIKEQELSLNKRGELFRKTYPYTSVDDFAPGGMEVQSINHQLNTRYDKAKIPTKLITVTYNNETIEVYVD